MAKKPVSRYKPGQLSRAPRPVEKPVELARPLTPKPIEKKFPVHHEMPEEWRKRSLEAWKIRPHELTPSAAAKFPLNVHDRETLKHVLVMMMAEPLHRFSKDQKIIHGLIDGLCQRSTTLEDFLHEPQRLEKEKQSLFRSTKRENNLIFDHLIFIGPYWKRAVLTAAVAIAYSREFKEFHAPFNPEHIATWLLSKNVYGSRADVEKELTPEASRRIGQSWIAYQADLLEKKMFKKEDPSNIARREALQRALESFSDVMLTPAMRRALQEEAHDLIQRKQYGAHRELRQRALVHSLDETAHQLHELSFGDPQGLLKDAGVDISTPRGVEKLKTVQRILLQGDSLSMKKRNIRKLVESQYRPTELRLNRLLHQLHQKNKLTSQNFSDLKVALHSPDAKSFHPGEIKRALRLWIQIELASRVQTNEVERSAIAGWINLPGRESYIDSAIGELHAQGMLQERGNLISFSKQGRARIPYFDVRTSMDRTGIKGKQRAGKFKRSS